jgi:HPt (histidine-containing phosphotransfer) domain-containing protein
VHHDAAAVARSAHTLSGASANLGATALARLCATLAAEGAGGDLMGGEALLDALEEELGRVRAAFGSRATAPC